MSSTLFQAPAYDPARERRRKRRIAGIVIGVLLVATLVFLYRNWPYERVVDRFFNALQHKNYEEAYAIWMHDPEWKQHPDRYKNYAFGEFYLDWGPGGEWGIINNYKIDGSVRPKNGSGVIVQVTVNGRADKARLWVEKKDKTLTFSPY